MSGCAAELFDCPLCERRKPYDGIGWIEIELNGEEVDLMVCQDCIETHGTPEEDDGEDEPRASDS